MEGAVSIVMLELVLALYGFIQVEPTLCIAVAQQLIQIEKLL